jgi:hypothetical protein
MSLSSEDHKWLVDQFEAVKSECKAAVTDHETRYHPAVQPLKTVATMFGIGAAGVTIIGGLLAAFYFLVRTAPR